MCLYGQAHVIEYLLEVGADVNAATDKQITPLTSASAKGFIAIVKLLLDRDAAIEHKNIDGYVDSSLMEMLVMILLEKL